MVGSNPPLGTIRSCGKNHHWCKICKPGVDTNNRSPNTKIYLALGNTPEARKRASINGAITRIQRGTFVGSRNPNYRGGSGSGYESGWKPARRAVWERDKVCRACGLPPFHNRRLDVHHVIPRRDGGTNDLSNLVGLHHGCHMKVEVGKMSFSYLPGHPAFQ